MALKINSTLMRNLEIDLIDATIAPFVAGDPGIGKTSLVKGLETLETDRDYKVLSIEANTLSDKGDLSGPRVVETANSDGSTSYKQIFFPHETVVAAHQYAVENPDTIVVLLLDEINRADSDVTSAILTLSTARKCGNVTFTDNLRFVFTGNLSGNVTQLDDASLTRFSLYEVEADAATWLNYMENHRRLHPMVKKIISAHPEYIYLKPADTFTGITVDDENNETAFDWTDDKQEMTQYTCPRTLEGLSEWLFNADDELLKAMAVTQVTSGAGGTGLPMTQLQLVLQGKTGATAFTDDLVQEVLNSFSTTGAALTSGPSVTQPACWTQFAAANHAGIPVLVDELEAEALGDLLLFTLTRQSDGPRSRAIIEAIATSEKIPALTNDQQKLFIDARASFKPDLVSALFAHSSTALVATLLPFKVMFTA